MVTEEWARRPPRRTAKFHPGERFVARGFPTSDARPTTRALAELRIRDPVLAAAMKRVPPYPGILPHQRRLSRFASLCRSIVYQQLAAAAAHTIWSRVLATQTGPISARGVLETPEEELRAAGLSRSKLRALRELAGHVDSGTVVLRGIERRSDDEIVEHLTQVWGVGEWTAQMFLMFKLGRLDVMPTGDLGVREGLRRLDGLTARPTPAELGERARVWIPLRSVASWVLWRLCDA